MLNFNQKEHLYVSNVIIQIKRNVICKIITDKANQVLINNNEKKHLEVRKTMKNKNENNEVSS